ncbi:hypothetical protein [Deinococcus sp. UR1]|uniref:hypothetical protein n=1 Tax=Deinococcus sp. UR1 TaxID=1704277 RepID=UPI00130421E7|nr:hypothetical protein [Deinococcus sp. UR1]
MTKFNEDELAALDTELVELVRPTVGALRELLGLGVQLEQQARALELAPDAPQDEQA